MALNQNHDFIVIDDDEDVNELNIDNTDNINNSGDGADSAGDRTDQALEKPIPSEFSPINCKDSVRAVFADICPEYLERLANEHDNNSDVIIDQILTSQEKGEMYPRKPAKNPLKRKRARSGGDDVDEAKTEADVAKDIRAKIAQVNYHQSTGDMSYKKIAPKLLSTEYVVFGLLFYFPKVHVPTIKNYLKKNTGSVFKTYAAMIDAVGKCKAGELPWPEKKVSTPVILEFKKDRINRIDMNQYTEHEQDAIAELRAARKLADFKQAQAELEAEEKANFDDAKSAGQTEDCGCCFEECAINRMICCDGEKTHRFCRDCMKAQVETNIGLSKHELSCMSMDGCSAGFAQTQRKLFLDEKTMMAWDMLEFGASLRMAGIENLETCPFCPYAAEYPPPEQNKEFRCENPDCEKTSCRLCRRESHIPITCEEYANEHGLSARHVLEEAMSEALIRKCNSCQHPYVKIDGCNKIKCTRCGTLQCYVCRATIKTYSHFNDEARGGAEGRCPLFESTDERHEGDVRQAEEIARNMIEKQNPGLTADALKFKVSDQVKKDEEAEQLRISQRRHRHGPGQHPRYVGDLEAQPRFVHPPQPGFVPPQPGFVPPQPGFVPPQPGFVPPQPGFVPPQPGFVPPHARLDPFVRRAQAGVIGADGQPLNPVNLEERPPPLPADYAALQGRNPQQLRDIMDAQMREIQLVLDRRFSRLRRAFNPVEGGPVGPMLGGGYPPLQRPMVLHDANPHRGDPAAGIQDYPRARNHLDRNANPQGVLRHNPHGMNE
ncbi:uncharacterized protein F4807DRAFT_460122 [Annulohypoxylon truncatum]|uniref:uncharacterized protein n=1 Tax=Annulohypoxylon truncatum TaxID=327061 RepID=UPI0020089A6A|nr:uncharacterized protein F4807DRAFT_460122 [Annulohypoxylon truncatum]KAI1209831.1 hypothetical protein F4807DRAFT_460122 [Annulohypoxylon truncatum]